MGYLARIVFSMVATVLAGSGVVLALVAGWGTLVPILVFAGAGCVLAVPVTWLIVRRLAGPP